MSPIAKSAYGGRRDPGDDFRRLAGATLANGGKNPITGKTVMTLRAAMALSTGAG
jgi:hypothetical protein